MVSIIELINNAKKGSAEAFLELVKTLERLCYFPLITRRQAWLGKDLVLVKHCTYILIDKRERQAYALVNMYGHYTVMTFDIEPSKSEHEISESICLYIEECEGIESAIKEK